MTVNVAMWSLKPKVERLLDIATKEPNRHLLVRRIFSTMIGFGAQTVVVSNAPCYNSIYDPSCGVYSYGRTTLGCLEVSSEMIPAGKSTHRPGSVTSASSTDRHGNGRKKSPPQGDACCATGEKGAKRSSFPHKDLAPRSACPAERQRQALPVERYLQRPPSSGCPNDAADAGYRAGLRCRSLVLSCCLGRRATTVGVLLALVSGAVCTGLNSREQVPDKPTLQQPWQDPSRHSRAENTLPSAYHPRIDLNVLPLFGSERGTSNAKEFASQVALDVSVIETLTNDKELRVLADFDSGAVRLWQELKPGSTGSPLVPLGLCPGEHSVSAWAITPFGNPSASATTTFTTYSPHGNAAATPLQNQAPASAVLLSHNKKKCDSAERQPPLAGADDTLVEHGKLCRVCPVFLDGYHDDSSQASMPRGIQQEQQQRPRRRRLILRTSLRAAFAGDTGEGEVEQEWPIELREGDSPASAARAFVKSHLGLDVGPEETAHEAHLTATGSDSRVSQQSAEHGGGREGVEGEGKRVVQWVAQRLEAELVERQMRRSATRAEATRMISNTGQLRVVLGSGPGVSAPKQGGWLTTDINTLDVTDPADFKSLLGPNGLVDAFLAEHVWEHLSLEDAHRAARNCHDYLHPGGRLRLAVPDPAWFASVSTSAADAVAAHAASDHVIARHRRSDEHAAINPMSNSEDKSTQVQHAREEAGIGGERMVHHLSSWLSREMLAADARDGHVVQFTPELLANVCWSAGFFPVLIEGGGGRQAAYGRPSAAAKTETVVQKHFTAGADDNAGDGEQGATAIPAKAPSSIGENNAHAEAEHLWGRVKRSIAGGDPRGAVSIVMDCIKPGREEKPEGLESLGNESGPRLDAADSRNGWCGLPIPCPSLNDMHKDETSTQRTQQQPDSAHPDTKREMTNTANHGGHQRDPSNQKVYPATASKCSSRGGGSGGHGFQSGDGISVEARISDEEYYCSLSPGKSLPFLGPGQKTGPNANSTPSEERLMHQENTQAGVATQATAVTADNRAGSRGEYGSAAHLVNDAGLHSPPSPPLLHDDGASAFSSTVGLRVRDRVRLYAYDNKADRTPTTSNSGVVVVDDDNLPSSSGVAEEVENEARRDPGGEEHRRRRQGSLEEWAAAARKSGRVDEPMLVSGGGELDDGDACFTEKLDPSSSASSSSTAERSAANLTTAAETVDTIDRNPNQRRLEILASTRARARKSLLDGNATATLELCQMILEESPSDGAVLLYQGGALAQMGQWELASDNMEHVLAISCGADVMKVVTTAVGDRGDGSHEGERKEGVPIERRQRDSAVPLDITLAAVANLASFAHKRVSDTLDLNAELFLLVEGLRGAADREKSKGEKDVGQEVAVVPISGFCDLLIMAARTLEEAGQLTSALRLYQRVVLLGGHYDQRALHGLGKLSRRLPQVHRQQRNTPTTLATAPSVMPGKEVHQLLAPERDTAKGCDWGIVHPTPGQVISPDVAISIEFDLSRLDPGLPAAGSLFKTVPGCRDEPVTRPMKHDGDGIGQGRTTDECGVESGLGVIVCSYLEGFDPVHCLPRGSMSGVRPGWHVLRAEAYQLPGLRPLSCPGNDGGGSERYSARTVRFCVGDMVVCSEGGVNEKHATYNVETPNRSLDGHSITHPGGAVPVPSSSAGGKKPKSTAKVMPRLQPTATFQQEKNPSPPPDVELPFCFMTLALNAMPFITHHEPTFRRVGEILSTRAAAAAAADLGKNISTHIYDPDPVGIPPTPPPEAFWEWHIVEGVAAGRADHRNPYSRRRIPQRYFDPDTGLSVDGTTEYLDDLECGGNESQLVHLHRLCEKEERGGGGGGGGGREGRRKGRRGARGRTGITTGNNTSTNAGDVPTAAAATEKCGSDGCRMTGKDNGTGGGDSSGGGDGGVGESSCLWRDKIQMTNTVVFSLEGECLLVQVDADELWTPDQLVELRDMFLLERNGGGNNQSDPPEGGSPNQAPMGGTSAGEFPAGHATDTGLTETHRVVSSTKVNPRETCGAGTRNSDGDGDDHPLEQTPEKQAGRNRVCAYFDCHFFVGSDLITVTEDGWGHSTSNEWLRAWVFQPRQSLWLGHAPPELARHDDAIGWELLTGEACIGRDETRRRGLVFTHYAYVLEDQVRFKSEFYGHSDSYSAEILGSNIDGTPETDAVAEWKALQDGPAPVLLADHLTWLREHGRNQDPRLLATVVDRPGSVMRRSDKVLPIVPLAPFLRQMVEKREREGSTNAAVQCHLEPGCKNGCSSVCSGSSSSCSSGNGNSNSSSLCSERRDNNGRGSEISWKSRISHEVNMRLEGRRRRKGRRAEDEGRASGADCGSLHLVVDGVVFQVEAAKPKGISRVWANVLPEMLTRLGNFKGTCLTFLVRSQAPVPRPVEEALHELPPDRFSVTRVPPYNPRFGFVSDQLMLSWVVRDLGATAFVSTMYTQPFRATTPNVFNLLLIHDLLPEVLGWDMSKEEWLQKTNAVASASAVVTVSRYSADEFLRIYPAGAPPFTPTVGGGGSSDNRTYPPFPARPVWAASNGVDTAVFRPVYGSDAENKNNEAFRTTVGLEPGVPYVMIVGDRLGYKNALTAYRALVFASPANLALVIVGGGPVTSEEAELLSSVRTWTHIGVGSAQGVSTSLLDKPIAAVVADVSDDLLAAGYSGAVALLHLSIAEGFGLTILEAFACGCPVVAADIPPVREIAGLPERQIAQAATSNRFVRPRTRKTRVAAAHEEEQPATWVASEHVSPVEPAQPATTYSRYDGAASPLEGGLVLVDDPGSAAKVWRAVRGLMAMDVARRAVVSEALVRRAKTFGSWRPLADALVKAAVE